ncbi:hypothetical protein [uncultured Sneathiella sp.]|uniref:hypothetical protein n=1 Tax=uncultured Sneathiella sp. TaxID=879315 RepID=UPI0030EE1284
MFTTIFILIHFTAEFIDRHVFTRTDISERRPFDFFEPDTGAVRLPGNGVNDGDVSVDEGLI